MKFTLIDRENWSRKEYFDRYFDKIPCTYSMCVSLDVTSPVKKRMKIYPAMLYSLTAVVNRHEEFRTAFDRHGRLGIYDAMLPCYTVFHKDTETFSEIWTEYSPAYEDFLAAYLADVERYGGVRAFDAKPDVPENGFTVSMIPWASFGGFNLNLPNGRDYLKPIFTMGKYREENGRYVMPLALQVHHAVCDGFHASRFVNELQELVSLL